MVAHPEFLYWALLVLLGVPAVVRGRSPVPLLVGACSVGDATFWAYWPSPQAEGLFLAAIYGIMLLAAARLRLDAAETIATAFWSPMAFCAFAQLIGGDPVTCFRVIYVLAVLQAVCFAFIRQWPYAIVLLRKKREKDNGSGDLLACTA